MTCVWFVVSKLIIVSNWLLSVLTSQNLLSNSHSMTVSSIAGRKARALYACKAEHNSELSFIAGTIFENGESESGLDSRKEKGKNVGWFVKKKKRKTITVSMKKSTLGVCWTGFHYWGWKYVYIYPSCWGILPKKLYKWNTIFHWLPLI